MKTLLYLIVEVIAKIHHKLLSLNDAFEYDFTLKIRLKAGIGCVFCLISVTLRCGFVSTDMDGCCIAIATAWVVYEFV